MPQKIAVVLVVIFGAWIAFLGVHLFNEVDARISSNFATLPSVGVLVTNVSASALAPVLVLCAYFMREKSAPAGTGLAGVFLNLLSIVLGGCIGWGLGVFLVPFDETDGAIYSRIGAGVTAFLSGFVVSYVHPIVEAQLNGPRKQAFLVQVGLGTVALLITGLAVTTNRTEYLESARLYRAEETALEAKEKSEIEAVKAKFAPMYAAEKIKRRMQQEENTQEVQRALHRSTSKQKPESPESAIGRHGRDN